MTVGIAVGVGGLGVDVGTAGTAVTVGVPLLESAVGVGVGVGVVVGVDVGPPLPGGGVFSGLPSGSDGFLVGVIMGVAVGGTGIVVGGTGVAVGGTGVAVGGTGVGVGVGAATDPQSGSYSFELSESLVWLEPSASITQMSAAFAASDLRYVIFVPSGDQLGLDSL